jgi:ribosomal protein L37E
VTTAVAPGRSLTAEDRCDRCGAQAYIHVELSGGGELLFCAHHGREHADKLRSVALNIHDESERLTETPATAELEER